MRRADWVIFSISLFQIMLCIVAGAFVHPMFLLGAALFILAPYAIRAEALRNNAETRGWRYETIRQRLWSRGFWARPPH